MKKKFLYVTVLALAGTAMSAAPMMQAQSAGSGTITIKDPAEYNAYNSAISQPTPQAKESAIEGFLQQYPNSVVKKQVLEILMDAYTQTGNTEKALGAARQVLQIDPTDLRALALSALYFENGSWSEDQSRGCSALAGRSGEGRPSWPDGPGT